MAKRSTSQTTRKRTLRLITIITAVAMVVGVFAAFSLGTGTGSVDLTDQPFMGAADAPVTVVEFGDYDCPYCQMFEQSIFPALKTQYIETGKVKFYFINYAFLGPESELAAAAARAVYEQDPQAFWRYHRALFNARGDGSQEWATPEKLVALAEQVVPEIDADALREALEQNTYRNRIQADLEMGRRAGVRGTPSIFVNGRLLTDPSYDTIRKAIEQALSG